MKLLHQIAQHTPDEIKDAGIRAVPAAVGVTIYSLTLAEWVAVVTLIYLVFQIIVLSPKLWEVLKGWWKAWAK